MTEGKSQAIESAIEGVRNFRFCGPSDDPEEQTAVTSSFRHLVIQLKRLAGPILQYEASARLEAIDVEVDNMYSAYNANAEIVPLLFDIEEALEAAKGSDLSIQAGVESNLPFSRRHNFAPISPVEITIREDAPEYVRMVMIDKPVELGWRPGDLRDVLCRVLRERPDPNNWSEYPNVWGEVEGLAYGCPWYKAYDIIEAIHKAMVKSTSPGDARAYADELNDTFNEKGIGWQLLDGKIVTRGDGEFERAVHTTVNALASGGRMTASDRIGRAIQALSARPVADTSGAISHATSAVECVLDDITGQHTTLGDYLKRNPDLLPGSVKKALEGLWGFASECGARHGREGVVPPREDAEFVVSISAATAAYLNRKHPRDGNASGMTAQIPGNNDDIPF